MTRKALFEHLRTSIADMDYDRLRWFVTAITDRTAETALDFGITVLTLCIDRRYPTGSKKRSSVIIICRQGLERIFNSQPLFGNEAKKTFRRITWDTRKLLRAPRDTEKTLLIDARGFQPEGRDCDASSGR